MSTVDKIKQIEEELSKTQKNKATSFHLGQLKAKLAKYRREILTNLGGGGEDGSGTGFDVARTGVASVGFIGFPSVGKSTLLSKLTGTHSQAAAYEFTTLTTIPGVIKYKGAKIQMLDLPGIIEGAKDGKGRGRQVIAVSRSVNLLFIVLDVSKPLKHKQIIEKELEAVGIRINKEPPQIEIKKKEKGGINYTTTVTQTQMDYETIRSIMSEYRINSADILFKCDATHEDLIDAIEIKSRRFIPAIYVLNKIDTFSIQELDLMTKIPNAVPISSAHGWNLDSLLEMMWKKLSLVRVYTNPKGKDVDFEDPVVLKKNRCTVEDFCNSIHKSLVSDFKNAYVYGSSVKHQPQIVGLSHVLQDEDVITIVKK